MQRTAAIDRARTLCTVLVVAYHAAQPYTYISHREGYVGFDLLVLFNDNFFMALMFFLSGLFVWPGLARKGVGHFLRDRAVRLGLPFVISVFVLMPIGLYPQALRENPDIGLLPFWLKTISEDRLPRDPRGFCGCCWPSMQPRRCFSALRLTSSRRSNDCQATHSEAHRFFLRLSSAYRLWLMHRCDLRLPNPSGSRPVPLLCRRHDLFFTRLTFLPASASAPDLSIGDCSPKTGDQRTAGRAGHLRRHWLTWD